MGKRPVPTIRVGGFVARGGRVLLVRQRRAAEADGPGYWLLPGGGLRHGESLADALSREIREELGLNITPGRPIALVESISPDPAYDKHVVHIILAAELAADSAAAPLPSSDGTILEARFVGEEELAALAIRPPLATHLARYRHGLPQGVQYLGGLW